MCIRDRSNVLARTELMNVRKRALVLSQLAMHKEMSAWAVMQQQFTESSDGLMVTPFP